MKDRRLFAAGIGFAFVAAWIAFSFGQAILCLLGAAIFWVVAGIVEGDLDLGELQGRLQGGREEEAPRRPPAAAPPRRPRFKSRVR
jgi:hypothetical protein